MGGKGGHQEVMIKESVLLMRSPTRPVMSLAIMETFNLAELEHAHMDYV